MRVVSIALRFPAAPVADQGADTDRPYGLVLDLVQQPSIDILLVFPLRLVIHDSPCGGELIVRDVNGAILFVLQVDSTGQGYPVNLKE